MREKVTEDKKKRKCDKSGCKTKKKGAIKSDREKGGKKENKRNNRGGRKKKVEQRKVREEMVK